MNISVFSKYGRKTMFTLVVVCCIITLNIFFNENRMLKRKYRSGISVMKGKNIVTRSGMKFKGGENASVPIVHFKEDISFDDVIIFVRTTTQNSKRRMRSLFESWLPGAFKRIKNLFVLSDGEDLEVSQRIPGINAMAINSTWNLKTYSLKIDKQDSEIKLEGATEMNLACLRTALPRSTSKEDLLTETRFCALKLVGREDLWCKTSKVLTIFSETDKKWFCHFDDDMYLNIDNLLNVLRGYDSNGRWYIGRRSETQPHYIPKGRYEYLYSSVRNFVKEGALTKMTKICVCLSCKRHVKIWFHNLGAGICFSRGLINKMGPIIRNNGFAKLAPSIGLHDDLVLGFIINHKLRIPFTESYLFHSQWENMSMIRDLEKQVTLGYKERTNNYLDVDGFTKDEDPHRFRSLHCKLHPDEDLCRILRGRKAVLNIELSDLTDLLLIYVLFIMLTVLLFRCTTKTNNSRSEKR